MKRAILFSLAAVSLSAGAKPVIFTDPYPPTVTQPDGAYMTINGGAQIPCTVETVAAGVRGKCDMAQITTPGTYTIVITMTRSESCTNSANTGTCTGAGSAASDPFTYVWRAGSVSKPGLRVEPQ